MKTSKMFQPSFRSIEFQNNATKKNPYCASYEWETDLLLYVAEIDSVVGAARI